MSTDIDISPFMDERDPQAKRQVGGHSQVGHVVCHPAGSHHVPGWGWVEGGDMSLSVQVVLSELYSLRLLAVDTGGRWHVDGDPVGLTGAGRIVLDRIGGSS